MDWFWRNRTEHDLPVAARNGDREAFERLVVGCRSFPAVCARLAGDSDEAEDLRLDALYRALRSIGSFNGSTQAQFAKWLNRIAVNAYRDRMGAPRLVASLDDPSLPDTADPSPTPTERAADADFGRHLICAVRDELQGMRAGADLWRCLALRMEGLSYEEIAGTLGGTSKEWKDRYSETVTPALARVRLRFALAGGAPVPGWSHADYELCRRRAEAGDDYATIAHSMKRKEDGLRRRWPEAICPVLDRASLHDAVVVRAGAQWLPDDSALYHLRMIAGHEYGETDARAQSPCDGDAARQREVWRERIGPLIADAINRMGRAG